MINSKANWKKVEKKFSDEQGLPFKEVLSEQEIRQALEEENVRYRKRLYTPMIVIWSFLSQVMDGDCSCRKVASRVLAFLVSQGENVRSASKSGYCKAKQRLKTNVLARLVRTIGKKADNLVEQEHLWCGRRVKTFDGSTLQMQDTEKNQAVYPQRSICKKGCGFPIANWAVLFCLSTGLVLEMYLESTYISERAMFRRFYKTLSPNDVVLADRGGCSFYDIALVILSDADAVFRMHASRKIDFRRGIRLGRKDHIVQWNKPPFDPKKRSLTRQEYDLLPQQVWVRETEFNVVRPGFRTRKIILATTLTDSYIYTKADLADLYLRRWEAELDIRHIKTTLKMDFLKSKTPEMTHKEVWAHLLVYNLIRRVMWQAATLYNTPPLRISFKGTIDHIDAFLPQLAYANFDKKNILFDALLSTIACDLVPKREGRIFQRCIKRRPKGFPFMSISRSDYRRTLLN